MVTPTVTFSADKAARSRTETQQDKAGKTYTAKKDVYTANELTITAKDQRGRHRHLAAGQREEQFPV